MAAIGILGQIGVVLSIALVFLASAYGAFLSDQLYMFPQGLIGLWLIPICWASYDLSIWLRAIGVLAGIGLVLITVSNTIIANALGWPIFQLTGKPSITPEAVSSSANRFGHMILPIGTLLGRILYPVWTIVVGYKLIRQDRKEGT